MSGQDLVDHVLSVSWFNSSSSLYGVLFCFVQLTLIELNFLKAIDVYELAVYLWESSNPSEYNTRTKSI